MIIKEMYTNKKDDWATPKELYNKLNQEFNFDFDPCPLNPTFNGLEIDWKERNFVNPPYSKVKDWVKKCYEEYKKGKLIVLLIFSRTDTKYFHEFIYPYAELRFIKGRLKFNDVKGSAPFPSMLCIFRGNK